MAFFVYICVLLRVVIRRSIYGLSYILGFCLVTFNPSIVKCDTPANYTSLNLDNIPNTYSTIHVDFFTEYLLGILFCIVVLFIGICILFAIGKKESLEGSLKARGKYKTKYKFPHRRMEVRLRVFPMPGNFWPLDPASALAINSKCYNVGIQVFAVDGPSNASAAAAMRGCLSQGQFRDHYQLGLTNFTGVFNPSSNNPTVTSGVDVKQDSGGYYSYISLPHTLRATPFTVTSNN